MTENLRKAGIETPEQLRDADAAGVFLRIVYSTACLHMLEALAGAVEDVRKSTLPPERKAKLKAFFKGL